MTKTMQKADWDQLAQQLSTPYGTAMLVVDGFEIYYAVRQDGMRLVIMAYVNGLMKGEWCSKKTEEAKRFCNLVSARVYTPAMVKKLTKSLSKSAIKKHCPDLDRKFTYYMPVFNSFASIKRQLLANNKSIELLSQEEALKRLAAYVNKSAIDQGATA